MVVIPVVPITNSPLVATQTVVLQIVPFMILGPLPDYEIGIPSNATVYIQGPAPTNGPPVVTIVGPTDRTVFSGPSDVVITGDTVDWRLPSQRCNSSPGRITWAL